MRVTSRELPAHWSQPLQPDTRKHKCRGSRAPGAVPASSRAAKISDIAAVRFLNQATFGASRVSIEELQAFGSYDAWIDRQYSLPISRSRGYTANAPRALEPRRHDIWWINAIEGDDQLRQRLAFAWSQIMVVNDIDYELAVNQVALASYYDMLAEACTGNFRDLLERVTLHPVMGIFLSMLRN